MKHSWILTASIYTLAASFSGAVAGYALGALGALVPSTGRVAAATLLAVIALGLGASELAGRHPRVLQCARETPRVWVARGAVPWAIRTGMALGFGATTRVGFWVWFTIPLVPFLMGDPVVGMVTYGTYGFVRASAVFVWVWSSRFRDALQGASSADWLIAHRAVIRRAAAAQLSVLALGALIVLLR